MDVTYLLDREAVPAGFDQPLHLLLILETWPEEKGKIRPPINLSLVIDKSGSMEGDKILATKEAAKVLVNKLKGKDWISVVTYGSQSEVLCPPTPGDRKAEICRKIDQIEVGGCTNLSSGWLRGLHLVEEKACPTSLNRVLLLTDGLANEGVTQPEELVKIGREYKRRNIITTTLGFGADFHEELLSLLAQESGGRFFFIEDEEKATQVFMEEFGELVRVVGQNLEVEFIPASSVPPPSLLGRFPLVRKEGMLKIFLGDLFEEDRRQLLTLWRVPSHWREGKHKLGEARVTYDCVRGNIGRRAHHLELFVRILPSSSSPSPLLEEVALEGLSYRIAEAKRTALDLEKKGDVQGALEVLERALGLLQESPLPSKGLEEEKHALKELIRELRSTQGLGSLERKSWFFHTYSQTTQLGIYKKRPSVFSDFFSITPKNPEKILDLVEKYKKILKSFHHTQSFLHRAEFVLRELVDNALKHGCANYPEGVVEGEVRISRNYFKLTLRDPGEGFDYAAVLAKQRESTPLKYRGLAALERMGVLLQFNPQGNQVSALLGVQRFLVSSRPEPYLTKDGLLGEVWVIEVEGNLDSMTSGRLEEELKGALQKGQNLALDLSKVPYISSSGVGVLIQGADVARTKGGKLFLVGLQRSVKEVLSLLGVEHFFVILPTLEEVIERLTRRSL